VFEAGGGDWKENRQGTIMLKGGEEDEKKPKKDWDYASV